MKIGIVISDQSPDAGGGFTFEQGLIEAIQRLRLETPHRLVMIGKPVKVPECLSEMPYISLTSTRPKETKLARECKRIVRKLWPRRDNNFVLDFQRTPQILAANLDLIVYLHPWVSPYVDIPYIVNVWDVAHRLTPFFPELSLATQWDFRERHYRKKLQRAAYIVCPNAPAKQEIVDFYQVAADRVWTLRHPTPADVLRQAEKPTPDVSIEHLGLRGEFLLYPAQFWPHKNHLLLLRMLKVLRDKYDYRPQLVLPGSDKPLFAAALEGNLSFVKQRVREMELEDQVIFAGFIPREVLIALYRRAFALVFPSFLGPENLPPLEAFALGCPVIASELPGSKEQFGEAAVRLDPKAPELWADAVQVFRKDSAFRAAQIEKGKIRARDYTSDDFIRGLFAIFEDFEPYRGNWTSAMSSVPLEPDWRPLNSPRR
jgi:glycosyltransferase involved in cell wall biosynthesis